MLLLQLLRTTYLDLYMLHHVGPSRTVLREVWIELTKLKAEGKIRALGVSNFLPDDLNALRDVAAAAGRDILTELPATLQSKFSPYHRGGLHPGARTTLKYSARTTLRCAATDRSIVPECRYRWTRRSARGRSSSARTRG